MVRFNLVHFVVLPVTQRLVARNITESQVNPSLEILKQKMQIMRGCVHAGNMFKTTKQNKPGSYGKISIYFWGILLKS